MDHTNCDGCKTGVVERMVTDYAPDAGIGYAPTNGSSVDAEDENVWYCASCTSAGVRVPVPVG
jgi:heterodisulfide reductase subunit C